MDSEFGAVPDGTSRRVSDEPPLPSELADLLADLRALQGLLQRQKRDRYNRRTSFGDLVTDRWQNARDHGFGEGSSCYDNVLVLGRVEVGRGTWIGPGAVLDGSGGSLVIGSHCDISAGVQIYTHSTVRRAVSLGRAPVDFAPTRIGNGVYIGPNSVIAMGVKIGDQAVIGAMSFVNSDIPAGKKAWGCPARIIGDADTQADQ